MRTLSRDRFVFALSRQDPPALSVAPGERFAVETRDCYSDTVNAPTDRFDAKAVGGGNPATGPIAVEGALPGDVLRADIHAIAVRQFAAMSVGRGGPLGRLTEGPETTIYPVRGGAVVVRDGLRLPVNTMIGVIGVAPEGDPVPTVTPGEHGGNLDCRDIAAGASVYLPVAAEGALLALGDLHAVMADGEVCGCGAEVSGEVTLSAAVLRTALPTPCVETAERLMFLGSALTLDECESIVLEKTHRFLTRLLGVGANEAARLMSLVGDLGVCQVVDPLKTMKFALPKHVLRALGMGERPA